MSERGHCNHAPKCFGLGVPDERDPLSCCNCGTREIERIVATKTEPLRQLLDDIREHLWSCGPPATGWGTIDRGRDSDQQALLKRINEALEPKP